MDELTMRPGRSGIARDARRRVMCLALLPALLLWPHPSDASREGVDPARPVKELVVAQTGVAPPAAPAPPGSQREQARPRPSARLFRFESSFWINLHHFLLREARPVEWNEAAVRGTLAPAAAAAWVAAVQHYRQHLASRSVLFDQGMIALRDQLATLAAQDDPGRLGLDPGLAAVLQAAAPVYRDHFWPGHDQANQAAIRSLERLVDEHAGLAAELAAHFRSPWPEQPIRVDLTVDADWAGAYTTIEPTHATIAAQDPRNAGDRLLEVVFHEAAHGLIGPVRAALDAELERQGLKLRRQDLWHTVLFFATGELVRRRLGPDYVPYADAEGLYQGPWAVFHQVVRVHWAPLLDQEAPWGPVIERMVAAIAQAIAAAPSNARDSPPV